MPVSNKAIKFRSVYTMYWFLLAYIVAVMVWWFIALNRQNAQMAQLRLQQLKKDAVGYDLRYSQVKSLEKRKSTAYIGEGAIFLMLIVAGAVLVFRMIRRQLKQTQEQQNFMMAVTHELKTPIAVAKLNLETLQKRKLDEQQQQRIILTTLQETNRLNALCNNLLLSSQMEAGGYQLTSEEIDFSELVNRCSNEFGNRFPDREISFETDGRHYIKGDMFLLQMVVNNLIDNAIKYSPKDAAVKIEVKEKNKKIMLQVADHGKGIADAEKEKIFKKFFRSGNEATKNAKGTGLGLYLSKKIMQQHKGNIFVTDNAPSGSIFTVTLDLVDS